jgi:iron-sulfur cluster assembly protein
MGDSSPLPGVDDTLAALRASSSPLLGARGQRERVDGAADLAVEDVVHEAVLLDAALPGEGGGGDGGAEVVTAAGEVFDLGASARDGGLYAPLYLLRSWHREEGTAVLPILGFVVTITDKGAEKVQEFLSGQQADVALAGLRVGVRGGGCSGFQYQLAFDEQRESDVVFESHGLKLLVDGESLRYVDGSVIDYEESLQGAGFKVSNPNVVAACGCGSSFRVAEEEQVSAL